MIEVAIALVVAAGCSRSESSAPAGSSASKSSTTSTKDPAKARELIAAGALVLDARTPDEYSDGHLPNATNVPVDDPNVLADVGRLARGDKTRPIVVYCSAGSRAAREKQTLEKAGYTNVVNGGGFDDLR